MPHAGKTDMVKYLGDFHNRLRHNVEVSFRRALIISDGDYWGLLRGGASKVFLIALAFLLALQGIAWMMGYRKRMADEAS